MPRLMLFVLLLLGVQVLPQPAAAAPLDGTIKRLTAREQGLHRDVTQCNRHLERAEQTWREAEKALRLSVARKDQAAEATARDAVAISRDNYNGYREICADMAADLQRAHKNLVLVRRLQERGLGMSTDAAVIEQRGQVERRSAAGNWTPLSGASAEPLQSGDRLRTGPNGGAELMLQDGVTAAQIAADTELQLTLDDVGNAVLDLSRGAFFAAVSQLRDHKKRMQVRTGSGTCSVRGTRFAVRQAPDGSTELLVLEGVVEAMPLDGGSAVRVEAGQRLVMRQGEPFGAVAAIDWNTTRRWWREEPEE